MNEKNSEKCITRTDLAVENLSDISPSKSRDDGYLTETKKTESATITVIDILNENGEKLFGKPKGKYVTVEVPPFGKDSEITDDRLSALRDELLKMIPVSGNILVAGLGNRDITADALGPFVSSQILATRHLSKEITKDLGLENLRNVSTIAPGVLGQTGIEVSDVIKCISELVDASAIISVDALAARELSRLGCTVQITDAGVAPGSGIGNMRPLISSKTMGIPVISVGVPTVVSVETIRDKENDPCEKKGDDFSSLIVTPKDIDLLVSRAAKLISLAINACLFPSFTVNEILGLTV